MWQHGPFIFNLYFALLGWLLIRGGDDDEGSGGALKYQAPKDPSRARAAQAAAAQVPPSRDFVGVHIVVLCEYVYLQLI